MLAKKSSSQKDSEKIVSGALVGNNPADKTLPYSLANKDGASMPRILGG
jgi:hypothetical protein